MRIPWLVLMAGLLLLSSPVLGAFAKDPYPLWGYVKCTGGTPIAGASVTAWNNNTSEFLRIDLARPYPYLTKANGYYELYIDSFPSGWATGQRVRVDASWQGLQGSLWVTVDGSTDQRAPDLLLPCPTPTPGGGLVNQTRASGAKSPDTPLPRFDLSNLTLEPPWLCPRTPLNVSVEVTNRGSAPGSYELVLRLDGVESHRRTLPLGVNESRRPSFTLVSPAEPGGHLVEMGSLAALLRVEEACPSPPPVLPPARVVAEETRRLAVRAGEETVVEFRQTDIAAILFTSRVDLSGSVTVRKIAERPPGVPPPPEAVFAYTLIETDIPPGLVTSIRVRLRVGRGWLEERRVPPEKVGLQRFADPQWQALETRPLSVEGGLRLYEAETPGFSLFATTGPEGPLAILPPVLLEVLLPIVEPLERAGRSIPLPLLGAALATGGAGALVWLYHRRRQAREREYP